MKQSKSKTNQLNSRWRTNIIAYLKVDFCGQNPESGLFDLRNLLLYIWMVCEHCDVCGQPSTEPPQTGYSQVATYIQCPPYHGPPSAGAVSQQGWRCNLYEDADCRITQQNCNRIPSFQYGNARRRTTARHFENLKISLPVYRYMYVYISIKVTRMYRL